MLPQVSCRTGYELVVDLFAGGGGMSTAIEQAIGRPVDIAINHDAAAISMHEANHAQTRHFTADIWEVAPNEATRGQPVGLLHLSPDCFPAGTMVLARTGYKAIETIKIGDEVLTHRGQWRKVTDTMRTVRPLLKIRGKGHPGLTVSPEHPFFVRPAKRNSRGDLLDLQATVWQKAVEMSQDSYWGSPTAFPNIPIPPITAYRGRTFSVDERLLWLAGRYVADGWTRLTDARAELVITCGNHEIDDLRSKLLVWTRAGRRAGADELAWHDRATGTAHQFSTDSRSMVEWLRGQFGHGAANKLIPGWLLGTTSELRRAFLDGYVSGDGCRPKTDGSSLVDCTTVSPALAYGLKSLALSLGYSPNIYVRCDQPDVIEGRKVAVRPAFSVKWRDLATRQHAHVVDGIEWAPVRQVTDLGVCATVFNISVEDDESYVVEGVIVHNCTDHSQSKGGQPRRRATRSLSWVGYRWAAQTRPRVITLENVKQILQWGPLVAKRDAETGRVVKLDGSVAAPGERVPLSNQFLVPDPRRRGHTWRQFIHRLHALGYVVEWRTLCAADFGAPTTRERLFLVARCDGAPIRWPAPTHFKRPARGQAPWRTAAECIDWTISCQSIFGRQRPLAEATLRRIARGIHRYVLESADPFIVPIAHYSGPERAHSIDDSLHTITAYPKSGAFAVCAPTLIQTSYGERDGQAPRTLDLKAPLGTVVDGGVKHGLSTAFLAQMNGGFNDDRGVPGHDPRRPMSTITNSGSQQQLVMAHLAHLRGNCDARDLNDPLMTISAGGQHHALVECVLSVDQEAGAQRVAAFLMRYYGEGGQWGDLRDPTATITTKDRLALVTVTIRGIPYVIVDIGLRMLTPRELYRAQGFPDGYRIECGHDGRSFSKAAQVRMCGNSVSPPPAVALLRENFNGPAEQKAVA